MIECENLNQEEIIKELVSEGQIYFQPHLQEYQIEYFTLLSGVYLEISSTAWPLESERNYTYGTTFLLVRIKHDISAIDSL